MKATSELGRRGCDVIAFTSKKSLSVFVISKHQLISCRSTIIIIMPKRQLESEQNAQMDQLPLKMVKLVNVDVPSRKER